MGFFSSSGEQGLLPSYRLLTVVVSSVVEQGLQGLRAPVVASRKLSIGSSQALEHRLNSCGARAYLLLSMWDLLRPGIEPMSPALASRLFIPGPPEKTLKFILYFFFFLIYFLLKDNCFAEFCCFLSNLKMNQS